MLYCVNRKLGAGKFNIHNSIRPPKRSHLFGCSKSPNEWVELMIKLIPKRIWSDPANTSLANHFMANIPVPDIWKTPEYYFQTFLIIAIDSHHKVLRNLNYAHILERFFPNFTIHMMLACLCGVKDTFLAKTFIMSFHSSFVLHIIFNRPWTLVQVFTFL